MEGSRQKEGAARGTGEGRKARGSVDRVGAGKQTTNATTNAYETSLRQRILKVSSKKNNYTVGVLKTRKRQRCAIESSVLSRGGIGAVTVSTACSKT